MVIMFNIGSRTALARRAGAGGVFALIALLMAVAAAQTRQIESASQPAYEGPRLAIPEKEKDFGQVTRGEILEATFVLQNVGTETLKVLRVKPG